MKFLSCAILLSILLLTWHGVNAPASISVTTHAGLQENLKTLIQEKVRELLPTANEIRFHNIYTEPIGEHRVRAQFTYSFVNLENDRPAAKTTLTGHAELSRQVESGKPADEATWSFDSLEIDGQQIDFNDETVIKSDGKGMSPQSKDHE